MMPPDEQMQVNAWMSFMRDSGLLDATIDLESREMGEGAAQYWLEVSTSAKYLVYVIDLRMIANIYRLPYSTYNS